MENQCEDSYLHDCLREFPDICKKKYGVVFDLSAVEKKVKRLRRKVELTYKDLSYFESPEHWWFPLALSGQLVIALRLHIQS